MAAAVVANHPEHLRERLHLRLPHLQRAAERVRQHQRRPAVAAFHGDVEQAAIGIDHGHRTILVMRSCPAMARLTDSAQACASPAYRATPDTRLSRYPAHHWPSTRESRSFVVHASLLR